jgi:site-specific recombinase XerC
VGSKVKASVGHVEDLLPSWTISLQAANRSPATVETYTSAVGLFEAFLQQRGMRRSVASIKREHVEAFLAWMHEQYKPASVRNRYTGLRQFFDWCVEEGEVTDSPMRNISPPQIPDNAPPILSAPKVKKLLKVCGGTTFEDRRDLAIVSVFLDTGVRLSELTGMDIADVDLSGREITVLGKGRRRRNIGLNVKASQAVDRYARIRRGHEEARSRAFWLGLRGPMTPSGVRQMLERVVTFTSDKPEDAHIGGRPGSGSPPLLVTHYSAVLDADTGEFLIGFLTA